MYESHRHYVALKKPDTNSACKWVHLHEVQKQEKIISAVSTEASDLL